MNHDITPINKGNYSMETDERNALFDQYRGEGWETEYKKYRRDWSENAKNKIVTNYPLQVDIEVSSLCNLKCPMCFTITDEFKKNVKTGLFDETLYYKIIDEIAGKVPALRLSYRGETTLHPRLVEFVRYAKDKGNINDISFLTNGSLLDGELFIALAEAGVNWITISVDGLGATYESIRRPLKFEDIFNRIRKIKEIKDAKGWHKPVIKIQSIYPAIRGNEQEFYKTFQPYVDQIAFNPLIDYLGNDSDILYTEGGFCCPQFYQRLFVCVGGNCVACSNDEYGALYVGDANKESIFDIWHGEKLSRLRELHSTPYGFQDIPTCRRCYLPRATQDTEAFKINDRDVIVKNYIGRTQEVGQ